MQFLQHISLRSKFAVIGVLAAVMLVVPSSMTLLSGAQALGAAQREARALPPAAALVKLLKATQHHRGAAAQLLGGNEAAAATRAARQGEVEQALREAQQQSGIAGDARLASGVAGVAKLWQGLARTLADRTATASGSHDDHNRLVAAQLDLLQDLSVSAGLVQHPGAGGYQLQMATLTYLPHLTEAFGRMRAGGAELLARGDASGADRARIDALASLALVGNGDAQRALRLASEADSTIARRIQAPAAAASAAAAQGIKFAQENVVQDPGLSMPVAEYAEAMTRTVDAQFALIDHAIAALQLDVERTVIQARARLMWVGGLLGVLATLAACVMVAVSRQTSASAALALQMVEAVEAGDLTMRADKSGGDEVARVVAAMSRMGAQLAGIVSGVRSSADGVAAASAQIAQGNNDLSSRTEVQASSLQQTAASMKQLAGTVRQNADNAQQGNQLAQEASSVAVRGGQVVGQVVETMKHINDSSLRIADIISVIDGIAFQTNILALNAAVEAARAGEQGRGFAVVAGEVRSLAHRSADAAREIKDLIAASVERVERGTVLVGQAGATMSEVVLSIRRVTDLMAQISTASSQQSAGVAHIGEAVSQMDQATQQNAALVEESAAAADSLRTQARQLVDSVAVFKLAV